jgi:very-short-patch-repair endonuclease
MKKLSREKLKPKVKFSLHLKRQIKNLALKNYSISEISKLLDLKYWKVYRFVKQNDVETITRGKSRTSDAIRRKPLLDKKTLMKLYWGKKLNIYQIAAKTGVNQVSIFNWMNRYEIPRRSKSEASKLVWTKEKRDIQRQLCNEGKIGVHAHGCNAYKNSWIELAFENWLNKNKLKFKKQFQFSSKTHRYDFHICGTNLIIETDGAFWHNKPSQKIKDCKFDAEAVEQGFQVIRFTDKEILLTSAACFDKILTYEGINEIK